MQGRTAGILIKDIQDNVQKNCQQSITHEIFAFNSSCMSSMSQRNLTDWVEDGGSSILCIGTVRNLQMLWEVGTNKSERVAPYNHINHRFFFTFPFG